MDVGYYNWITKELEGQLITLFCNYCSLGQYELARASLIHLCSIDKSKALSYLNRLILSQSPKSWLLSKTVPSRGHLLWLCLTDHKRLRGSQTGGVYDFPPNIWKQVEFALLLECVNNQQVEIEGNKSLTKVLSKGSKPQIDSPGTRLNLSLNSMEGLKNIILKDPLLGSALSTHLKQSQPSRRFSINTAYIEIISALLDGQLIDEAINFFQYLSLDSSLPQETEYKNIVDIVFKKFLKIIDNNQQTCLEKRKRAYSSFLSIPDSKNSCLFQFLQVEDALIKRLCMDENNDNIPWPFRVLDKSKFRNYDKITALQKFWLRYFNLIRLNSYHCLEYVLARCCDYISRQEWDKCSILVEPFPVLKPLLLLLTCHQFRGNTTAYTDLVKLLWGHSLKTDKEPNITEPSNIDPVLRAKCDHIAYQVSLTWWCVDKLSIRKTITNNVKSTSIKIGREYYPVVTSEGDSIPSRDQVMVRVETDKIQSAANVVFSLLQDCSLIFVMQSYLHNIPSKQVIQMIQNNPKSKGVSSRSTMDIITQDLRLVYSYYAIRNVMEIINEVALDNAESSFVKRKLLHVEQHVMAVVTMPSSTDVVMVLLETIFALLFVKAGALMSLNTERTELTGILMRSKLGGKDTMKDRFIVTLSIAEQIIHLIKKLFQPISTHPSAMNKESLFYKRLSEFKKLLYEAEWRHSLIKKLSILGSTDTSSVSLAPYWNIMLADPETLLNLCIRERNWECAHAVIKFFSMDKSYIELATRAETYYKVRHNIEIPSSELSIESMVPDVSSPLTKFLVCMDISVAVATTSNWCDMFLKHGKEFLLSSSIKDSILETFNNETNPAITHYPTILKHSLERLEVLIKDSDVVAEELSLRDLFVHVETYPMRLSALKQYLALRSALKR